MIKNEIHHTNVYVEKFKLRLNSYSKSLYSFDSLLVSDSLYVNQNSYTSQRNTSIYNDNDEVTQLFRKVRKSN